MESQERIVPKRQCASWIRLVRFVDRTCESVIYRHPEFRTPGDITSLAAGSAGQLGADYRERSVDLAG